jgi:hypothetical protein
MTKEAMKRQDKKQPYFGLFLYLCGFAAICAISFYNFLTIKKLNERNKQLESEVVNFNNEISRIKEGFNAELALQKKQIETIASTKTESANTESIQPNISEYDILFDIQMASYQLHLFRNIPKANYWLEKAQQKTTDPVIQAKITHALTAIAKLDEFDPISIVNKLRGINRMVSTGTEVIISKPLEIVDDKNSDNIWQKAKKSLEPYLVISHIENKGQLEKLNPKNTIHTTDFTTIINLAEWALTTGNNALFQKYITSALKIAKQDSNELFPEKILNELEELQNITIPTLLPDLSTITLFIQQHSKQETPVAIINKEPQTKTNEIEQLQPQLPQVSEEF